MQYWGSPLPFKYSWDSVRNYLRRRRNVSVFENVDRGKSRIESLLCAAVSEAVYEASLYLFPLCPQLIYQTQTEKLNHQLEFTSSPVLEEPISVKSLSHCPRGVLGTTTSLAVVSPAQPHYKGSQIGCRGLSCPPQAPAEVPLPAGGSCLPWESSAQGSGAAEPPSSRSGCCAAGWILFSIHCWHLPRRRWGTGTDNLSCTSIAECTWNGGSVRISNWAFPAGILQAGVAYVKLMFLATIFSQRLHYQLFIKAELDFYFFSGQLCYSLMKLRNNNAPHDINMDYF